MPSKSTVRVVPESHLDHNIRPVQLQWLLEQDMSGVTPNAEGVRIRTFELPESLGTVPSVLHGPIAGDEPISEGEVYYSRRGSRSWPSRLVRRAPRQVRQVTMVVGSTPEVELALFTVYGGPAAPREVADPNLPPDQKLVSTSFWSEHALSDPGFREEADMTEESETELETSDTEVVMTNLAMAAGAP